ncbi:hypothetical protein ACFX13_012996 [Malus domestica]
MTMKDALNSALDEEMSADPKVFLIGEEVGEYQGAYKITKGLLDKYGSDRVLDTPIIEAGFTGIGVGAAYYGLKPVIEFMTFNFSMQAIDHIINSAAKSNYMSAGQINVPIVFRGPNGVVAGVGAQHSQSYAAWYAACPGLKVLTYSSEDARGLLKAAIKDPDPVVFLENELLYGESFPVSAEVLDPVFASQLEKLRLREKERMSLLQLFRKWLAILYRLLRYLLRKESMLSFGYLDAPVERISGADVPMPYAANLERLAVPQVEDIVRAAKRACYKSSSLAASA